VYKIQKTARVYKTHYYTKFAKPHFKIDLVMLLFFWIHTCGGPP